MPAKKRQPSTPHPGRPAEGLLAEEADSPASAGAAAAEAKGGDVTVLANGSAPAAPAAASGPNNASRLGATKTRRLRVLGLSFAVTMAAIVAVIAVVVDVVVTRQAPEYKPPPELVKDTNSYVAQSFEEPDLHKARHEYIHQQQQEKPMSNESIAKLVQAFRSIPECCFEADPVGELPLMSLASASASNRNLPAILTDWPTEIPPDSLSIVVMQRTDIGAHHLEFNVHVDRLAMREENYNDSKRILHVTGVQLPGAQPLSSYDYRPFTLGCSPWEGSAVPKNFNAGVCAMSAQTYFQARVSMGDTVINVYKGRVKVMLTRDGNIDKLHLFPVVHPLRGQSQLAYHKFPEHAAFTAYPYTKGLRVPVHNVTLEAGEALWLPPAWGHRVVALNDSLVAINYAVTGPLLKARAEGSQLLPKMLQFGALRGQPMFLGMWALAVYADTLFGFKTAQDRMGTTAESLVFARWGAPARVWKGHTDDPSAPAVYAKDLIDNVKAECAEMAATPKDLMLHDRARFMEELQVAADKVDLLIQTVSSVEQIRIDFKINQCELAIAECLGVAATAPFFNCYFAGFKRLLR